MKKEHINDLFYSTCMIGHGKTNNQNFIECGLKDICDVLKNILAVGTLFFACVTMIFYPMSFPSGISFNYVFWVAIFGAIVLSIFLIFLLGQLFVVISKLPLIISIGKGVIQRTISVVVFLLAAGGAISGLLLFVLIAIQALPDT